MVIGLPGRVLLGRLPEWTPDVRYFSSEEYPRVNFAQRYDGRGTLALPVFERGSQASLGVVEVVMTTQNIDYHPELENICNALQGISSVIQAQEKGKSVLHPASLSLEFQEQESEEYNVTSHWDPAEVDLHSGKPRIENARNETEKSRQNQRKLSG